MDIRTGKVLDGFHALKEAAIDASSIIYMHKAGFLDTLGRAIDLHSPPEIIAEAGYRDLHIKPIALDRGDIARRFLFRAERLHGNGRATRESGQGSPVLAVDPG